MSAKGILNCCVASICGLWTLPAAAVDQVTVSCDNLTTTVFDGSMDDLENAASHIRFSFACNPGAWSAAGEIDAILFANGETSLTVTDALLQNHAPGTHAIFDVEHSFTSFVFTPVAVAEFHGDFVNVQTGFISDILATFSASVNGATFDSEQEHVELVAGPIPFAVVLGPEPLATVPYSEGVNINVYLDAVGDAISLPDSAVVRLTPEPGTAGLLGAALLALRRRERRSRGGPDYASPRTSPPTPPADRT